jgi:hypothetical protein
MHDLEVEKKKTELRFMCACRPYVFSLATLPKNSLI